MTTLHFIQWAILDEGTRLLLAVTFEGPWEAYIRNIVDQAGPFLDTIFCHCEGYSGGRESHATANGYDGFARWVREHQVEVSFFHSAAPDITANDIAWLRNLDALRGSATFAADSTELTAQPGTPPQGVVASDTTFLQVLSAFFTLSQYFPAPDNVFLERAASKQLALLDPGKPPPTGTSGEVQDAWNWYALRVLPLQKAPQNPNAAATKNPNPVVKIRAPNAIQGNILNGYSGMVDGLLVFVQFASAAAGAQFVASFHPTIRRLSGPIHEEHRADVRGLHVPRPGRFRGSAGGVSRGNGSSLADARGRRHQPSLFPGSARSPAEPRLPASTSRRLTPS